MRSVSDRFVEEIKAHIFAICRFAESRTVYEIIWKNMIWPDRP